MALIDIGGATVGSAAVSGPLAVAIGLSATTSGNSAVTSAGSITYLIHHTLTGSGIATGELSRTMDLQGHASGSSATLVFGPEPLHGVAVVTGFMEVGCVPPPICQTPQVQKRFRWGQQFGMGGLEICVTDKGGNPLGPVCISYTLYQLQKGCEPKQVGPSGRRPGNPRVGCYYATGTAGECGQPGLWLIRWRYQRTFGGAAVERDSYFYVLDSILCPVRGDALARNCKYGWD